MENKDKNNEGLDVNGKKKTRKEIEKRLAKHRIKVLSKYVDKNFMSNPDFISKLEAFMDGNIKLEIMEALDDEYSVLKNDPNDEAIIKMVDAKVKEFIEKLYP